MKKFSLLSAMFAAMFFGGNVMAQDYETVLEDTFESYSNGDHIAQAAIAAGHDYWTTWDETPGSAADAVITNEDAASGSQSMKCTYGNDVVLKFGNKQTGIYNITFDMKVPTGKDGYFNLLREFAGSGSEWATEVYINSAENGTAIETDGTFYDFTFPLGEWVSIKINIDLAADWAQFFVNGNLAHEWQYSRNASGGQGSSRAIDAMDFYPPTSAAVSTFYVDNVKFEQYTGELYQDFNITPNDKIEVTMAPDDITSESLQVSNDGNSIGDWMGYIEYEPAAGTAGTADLYFYQTEIWSGIGSSGECLREMAIQIPASAYANVAMGMSIVSARFYIYPETPSVDYHYTFRVYGQGFGQPGELLAEKTLTETGTDMWLECTFDNPVQLLGEEMWVTVELLQVAGGYPLSCDNGPATGYADWCKTDGGTWSRICESNPSLDFNWMIDAHAAGQRIPGWATMSKQSGTLKGGETDDVDITFSSMGMTANEYYTTLHIFTTDEEHPQFDLPLTLGIPIGVEENADSFFSVYPNPSNGIISIEGEDLDYVTIYNAAGQFVKVVKLGNNVNSINFSEMGSGIYFLNVVNNNNESSVKRIVVE